MNNKCVTEEINAQLTPIVALLLLLPGVGSVAGAAPQVELLFAFGGWLSVAWRMGDRLGFASLEGMCTDTGSVAPPPLELLRALLLL